MSLKKIAIKKYFNLLLAFVIIAPTIILCFSTAAHYSLAAATDPVIFNPSMSIPGSNFKADVPYEMTARTTGYIGEYISAYYSYAMGIVGILAVIVLMIGGVIWLTSGGNPSKVQQAKDLIIGSITGTGLLLASWVLLNTVNPNLVKFKLNDVGYISEIDPTYCCDKTKGLVLADVTQSGTETIYKCPGASLTCADAEKCLQTEKTLPGTTVEGYSCLKESDWGCCQFISTFLPFTTRKSCLSVKYPANCGAPPSGFSYDKQTYVADHVCDPDGGAVGWPCYSGGRQCCECKTDDLMFGQGYLVGLDGIMMEVDCQDNLTTKECSNWCVGGLNGATGNKYTTLPSPAKCQTDGYCGQK